MTDPFFLTAGAEWPVLLILALCTFVTLFAMVCVARHDYLTFEIDYRMLALAGFAALPVLIITGGMSAVTFALLTAGACGGATAAARRLKPGRLGQGDIPLMGFLGFVSGPDGVLPALAALVICSALTAALYSLLRRKPLPKSMFRSMFPFALPVMPAAMLALGLRFAGAGEGYGAPMRQGMAWAGDALIFGAALAVVFGVGMAVGAHKAQQERIRQ